MPTPASTSTDGAGALIRSAKVITLGKQASPGFSSLGRNRGLRGTVIVRWRLAYQARSWRVTW